MSVDVTKYITQKCQKWQTWLSVLGCVFFKL